MNRQIELLTAQERLQIFALASRDDNPDYENEDANTGLLPRASTERNTTVQFDISHVLDAIKMIMPYKGDKKTLAAWLTSVEQKIEFAKKLCPSPTELRRVMPLWVSVIRDKIQDEALLARRTPCE